MFPIDVWYTSEPFWNMYFFEYTAFLQSDFLWIVISLKLYIYVGIYFLFFFFFLLAL